MALRLKIGTVTDQKDITRTGQFWVQFGLNDGAHSKAELVRYVTPYGNKDSAFIAIPPPGSQVLCAHEDDSAREGSYLRGYYYLGSVMGTLANVNETAAQNTDPNNQPPSDKYVPSNIPGLHGPGMTKYETAYTKPEDIQPWPRRFQNMYDGKGVVPEQIGLTNYRGDAFQISSRYNSSLKGQSQNPFQDYRIGMMSGNGKRIECIDSPIVDGIVISNEHRGKDYLIWSSGMSDQSPFSEGEVHWRTHGPFNLYTLVNNFHIWVEDGFNMEIENKSTGSKAYGDISTIPDGRVDENGTPMNGLGDPGVGGYVGVLGSGRKGVFGNETTGCINLTSHHNNIAVSALEVDSVVHVHAPGLHSRVIIDTGGTVDIVARGKITLQSSTEIELNAPEIDINAGAGSAGNVYIDGDEVHLNQPHTDGPEL